LNNLISGCSVQSHRHASYVGYSTFVDEVRTTGLEPALDVMGGEILSSLLSSGEQAERRGAFGERRRRNRQPAVEIAQRMLAGSYGFEL